MKTTFGELRQRSDGAAIEQIAGDGLDASGLELCRGPLHPKSAPRR